MKTMFFQLKALFITLFLVIYLSSSLFAAYIEFFPVELQQPDGTVFSCFASGDEYYNWLHDSDGFTIIQDTETGWYVYGNKVDGVIVPTKYVVSSVNPKSLGIAPWLKTDLRHIESEIADFKATQMMPPPGIKNSDAPQAISGTINNIVVFIRFSDDPEFTDANSTYNNMFNTENQNSMKEYFREISYQMLSIDSYFYPVSGGTTVISYQDAQPRGYYQPYSSTNTIGYTGGNNGSQRRDREHILLRNAINAVNTSIPSDINFDYDNDGYVDNVCFIVYGTTTAWSSLLWPHMWTLYSQTAYVNSKRVWRYNFQIRSHLLNSGNGVLAHEMYHTLGAPDLYHYSGDGLQPVGRWDLMEQNANPPQHMGAYMKYKYGNWISSIPTITEAGTYTLNPVTSSTNNCYKIPSPNSTNEYFVVEYRRKTGRFENSLPGTGLLIYRINPGYNGNANGPPDEVYIYRPNGTTTQNGQPNNANYSQQTGRIAINNGTNPKAFLTNGSDGDLNIDQISSAGETISFRVNFEIGGRPQLSTPPTGSLEVSLAPTFTWQPYSGANSYIFELSTVSDFTSVVTRLENYTQTSYSYTGILGMNMVYYWRVRAKVGQIYSDWSEVWNFTTAKGIETYDAVGTFCAGSIVTVNFHASPVFSPGNYYIAQLSDTSGMFYNPINLGSMESNESGDLQITVTLPDTLQLGYGYRFRVIADMPTVIGSPTEEQYLIVPILEPIISDIRDTVCLDYVNRYYTSDLSYLTYNWTIMGGSIIGPTDAPYVDVVWEKLGNSWLKIEQTASTGCHASRMYHVEVIENPVAKFMKADSVVCVGSSGFYLADVTNINRTEMFVKGGRLETIYSQHHIKVKWDTLGIGQVILVQYNQGDCPDTVLLNVRVIEPPSVSFSVVDTVCGLSIQEYSTSIGPNESAMWEATNGTVIGKNNEQNVIIKWSSTGVGNVKLKVSDKTTNCTGEAEHQVYLLPNNRVVISGKLTGCESREGVYSFNKQAGDSLVAWYVNNKLIEDAGDTLRYIFNEIGIYNISAVRINSIGCPDSASIAVEVFETPAQPTIVQSGDTLFSDADKGNLWFFNDELIPGERYRYLIPNKSGRYSAAVENANKCRSDMSNYIDFVTGSVRDISSSEIIKIYPTVSDGIVNIRFNLDIKSAVSIHITNELGANVYSSNWNSIDYSDIKTLDLGALSQGIYFIYVDFEGLRYYDKIILIR